MTIEKALKVATCCGLQNVSVLDAVSGIKPWNETLAMLEDDMVLIDPCIAADNWSWSPSAKLWAGPNDPLA